METPLVPNTPKRPMAPAKAVDVELDLLGDLKKTFEDYTRDGMFYQGKDWIALRKAIKALPDQQVFGLFSTLVGVRGTNLKKIQMTSKDNELVKKVVADAEAAFARIQSSSDFKNYRVVDIAFAMKEYHYTGLLASGNQLAFAADPCTYALKHASEGQYKKIVKAWAKQIKAKNVDAIVSARLAAAQLLKEEYSELLAVCKRHAKEMSAMVEKVLDELDKE
uniref:Nucleocapsid n=1 Tax=Leptomonas pyrrhocoris leishbunyavirus 4 TaxID=3070842 RepID=A0AA50KI95_9VIRU|nr:nucleocapsid [Leptomonas pyrrhocoris leishbunyavirus 4]